MWGTGLDRSFNMLFPNYTEKTNNVKNSYEELRSSALTENVVPTSFSSFLLPPGGLSKYSGLSYEAAI